VGSSYTDAGATANDNVDGDISANIVVNNPVDTTTLGTYTVTYNVSDAAGNAAAEVTRTVHVVDTTAPAITLLGSNPQEVLVGTDYAELGATASDSVDGDISANITIDASAVDTSVAGSYNVTYTVADSAGNEASVTRTVRVVASDWYGYEEEDGVVTYKISEGTSNVTLPADKFEVSANADGLLFEGEETQNIGGCSVRTYIIMHNDGQINAGYIQTGGTECSTDIHENYAQGTTVNVGSDMVIRIETPLTTDIVFGE
jgi:hypothetical protein